MTFAPWSKHGVGGYGHASLIIIDHHWSSIVEIQAELIYSIIQYILMNPLNDHPYKIELYDCMTFKGNPPYGSPNHPPDAWEFDSRIPERGKLAAMTLRSAR